VTLAAVLGSTVALAAMIGGLAPAGASAVAADDSPPATTSPTASATPPTTPSVPPSTTPSPTPSVTTPTVAPATTAAALAISLDQPATTWEDRPVPFTGKLSNGATNWFVSLWQATTTGWVMRAYSRSTAGGAYRITYTPPAPLYATFRTVIGPSYTKPLAASPTRIVTAQDRRLVLNKPAPAYTALTGVAVTGRLTPSEPGRAVVVQDRLANGTWRSLREGTIDANGNFRLPVPDNIPASRSVRVVTARVPATAVEVSNIGVITVKAYLNPKVYAVTASMVPKTYRAGCPVGPSSLRLLTLNHWGLDGVLHRGELIVRDAAVQKMITVWNASLVAHFPIRRMQRVDVFGGSDVQAMAADNTSVFNCRQVTGDPYSLSPHSYGRAIDVNTVENPYLAANNVWYPSNGLSYRDRSNVRKGMLFDGSTPTKALKAQGYFWGKAWRKPDYQHFEPQ
jgi:hypothetical protein